MQTADEHPHDHVQRYDDWQHRTPSSVAPLTPGGVVTLGLGSTQPGLPSGRLQTRPPLSHMIGTSPTIGSSIVTNGILHGTIADPVLTTTCSLTLTGRLTSRTTAIVSSGSANRCSLGTFVYGSLGIKRLVTAESGLTGEWSLGPVAMFVDTGIGIQCTYGGTLAGRWALSADGRNTVLTLGASLHGLVVTSGGPLCLQRPALAGSITLLGVITG